jgi:hypothetical protein
VGRFQVGLDSHYLNLISYLAGPTDATRRLGTGERIGESTHRSNTLSL